MQKLESSIYSDSEADCDILVTVCARELALFRALGFLQSQDSLFFWSINISPDYMIKSRGKPKRFKDCRVAEQHQYFNHRILKYAQHCQFLDNTLIVVEHSLSGNVHFHLVTPKTQYIQNVKSDIIQLFDINTRKYEHLNIKMRPVDDIFKTIAYIFKAPISWVSKKDCQEIDEFNISIEAKQYEISKFHTYFLEKKKNI